MMKLKVYLFLLMLGISIAQMAQPGLLYFVDSNSVHLRWNGIHTTSLQYYKVYRKRAGTSNWTEISGNIKPVYTFTELRKLLGYKTGAYLQLFGMQENDQIDIPNSAIQKTFSDPKSISLLGVMSLINPEFAKALGELFVDKSVKQNESYFYKITYTENGAEKDLIISNEINCSKLSTVPGIKDLKASAKNGMALLNWKRETELLKNATVVTYSVFRAEDIIGPYTKENYYGFIPLSITTGNAENNVALEQYKVSYLENSRKYYFYVKSVNAFGIESAASATVECTPFDNTVSAPTGVTVSISGKIAKLIWSENQEVEIYRSRNAEVFEKVYPPASTSIKPINLWYDFTVEEGNEYRYFLKAIRNNAPGNSSDTVKLIFPDITPPGIPNNVRATSKKGLVILEWNANTEKDILGYEVERASDKTLSSRFLLTSKPITQTFFRDSLNYKSQTLFGYIVYAIDINHNRSVPSKIVTVKLPDFDPPSPPILISLKESDAGVEVKWEKGLETDIAKYAVYRASKKQKIFISIGETKKTSFTDDVKDSGTYLYAVAANDSAGNEGKKSNAGEIIVEADKSKLTPINGKIERKGNTLILHWSNAPGARPEGFVITRVEPSGKRIDIAQRSANVFEYTDMHPIEGKLIYEIRSRNKKWQMGKPLKLRYDYQP